MKTIAISIQDFEEEMKPTFKEEDYTALADTYRKQLDMETAMEMLESISKGYTKQAEEDTLLDKLLYVMLEAFVRGAVHASEITAEAMAQHAVEVLKKHAVA